jgi:hypothetical protein
MTASGATCRSIRVNGGLHDANPSGERRASCLVLGNVLAHHAFVTLQRPLVVRAFGEPVGDADLAVYLTARHGDARLLAGGDDLLHT